MSNVHIPREDVHSISESCADTVRFPAIATRLLKEQKKLTRFVKQNAPVIEGMEAQVASYLYTVIVRVFDAYGGKLARVQQSTIDAAAARVQSVAGDVLPFDDDFPERVRGIEWRAQPHILDEALWALFERDEVEDTEIPVEPDKAGLIFLVLWAATEALDASWSGPAAEG